MDKLIMPASLARLHVERDETGAEEIRAWTMAAVFVHQRHADRDVHQSELGIGGVRRPCVVLPDPVTADLGALRPCLRPELARLRNEIELPELLPSVDV